VMAAARSAHYSPVRKPTDLRQAVLRLGIRTLRDITLEVSLQAAIFERPVYVDVLRALGRHSRATAYAVPCVCRAAGYPFEHAFIAGLFHDIGFAGALLCVAGKQAAAPPYDARDVLVAVDDIHGSLGMDMVAAWDLPAQLRTTIWRHHEAELYGAPLADAASVLIAEQIVLELGYTLPAPLPGNGCLASVDHASTRVMERGQRILDLSGAQMERLSAEIEETLERHVDPDG
jgi:HD-like signal output (HDOD) protein